MITFNDLETVRQQRNLTSGQKKNNFQVKEGVIANKYISNTKLNLNLQLLNIVNQYTFITMLNQLYIFHLVNAIKHLIPSLQELSPYMKL